MVFVIVHTPWPTLKGLDHPYLHIYVCLLSYFTVVLTSLALGFAMFDTLSGFVVLWLHSMPTRPCLDVTTWDASLMLVALCIPFPFSALCDDVLTMLVYATRWLSLHLYTLAYMSMHESCLLVCHPYFNTMKLWTSDPNLHLSLANTTFCCFIACLPFCSFACFPAMLAVSVILICFMPLSYTLCISFVIACLLVSCLCLCMYVHGARMLGARARSPRRKRKGCRHKHVNMSQVATVSRSRSLAYPFWLCTLSNPFLPFPFLS